MPLFQFGTEKTAQRWWGLIFVGYTTKWQQFPAFVEEHASVTIHSLSSGEGNVIGTHPLRCFWESLKELRSSSDHWILSEDCLPAVNFSSGARYWLQCFRTRATTLYAPMKDLRALRVWGGGKAKKIVFCLILIYVIALSFFFPKWGHMFLNNQNFSFYACLWRRY